jgi:hypothetical protein
MPSKCVGLVLLLLTGVASPLVGQISLDLPPAGKPEFSLLAGFGYSVHVNRARTDEELLMVQPQAGFRIGPRLEWLVEAHFAQLFRPEGWAVGLVPVSARYFFGAGSVAPYFGVGVGFCWTNLRIEEIDRRFNFLLEAGAGIRGTPRAGRAWMAELRWLHYSNAGTVRPNLGFNAVVLLAGWRFR